ncbi:plasmid mobilization relaxosome protein MobC [Streptacidiphilus sp. P02-A3a]|uniref:plasmid mobilization relaxosome protein MobC n=1 Tax=Streptacidiphilus sp. P02-A3a TaxID=2704468 RepID=UPI0015FDBF9D|nr:plasmid mobilization relaxosome protein MobC [Streptacidiphilus sp. P02-A3a]QMU67126.1 plasmid mobilization relaxosome protein MobC [Streptacidiphilus sp. P02-A3a]
MNPNPFRRKTKPGAEPIDFTHHNTVDASQNHSGASWSNLHIAGGDAGIALDPAPAGAGAERAQRGTVGQGQAERGLLPGQAQPTALPAERFAPTVTDDDFVQRNVAALDIPALTVETDQLVTSRRPLSEILYRPRSGTKRDIQLTASAEPAEKAFIDLAARAAKRSRSAFLMDAALTFAHAYLGDQRPYGVPALPSPQALQDLTLLFGKLVREVHRVGINLNQLTRAVNTGGLPDRAEEVLDEVHALARAGRRALEHVVSGCRHGA